MKRASLFLLGISSTIAGSALAQEAPPAPPKGNMMPHVPPVALPGPKGEAPGAKPPAAPPPPAPRAPAPPLVPAAPPAPPVAPLPHGAAPVPEAPAHPHGHPRPPVVAEPAAPPAPAAPPHGHGAPPQPPVVAAPQPPIAACPPGAFCEPGQVTPPPPPAAHAPVQAAPPAAAPVDPYTVTLPAPRPGTDPHKPRVVVVTPGQNGAPDEVVVYDDGAYPPPNYTPGYPPPPNYGAPPTYGGPYSGGMGYGTSYGRNYPRYGVNARLDAVLLPQSRYGYNNAGMGGAGASFRYRPVPFFALDFGFDVLGGIDSNGFSRREVPLSATTMLYVNPRSFAQFYLLGGLDLSFASVASDYVEPNFAGGTVDNYTYFGGHFGGGVDFRFARALSFNIDLLGTLRSRIDGDGFGRYPEYYDAKNGLGSNSSGGGLLRAGLTLWW